MSVQMFDVVVRCDARGLAKVMDTIQQSGSGAQFLNLTPVRDMTTAPPLVAVAKASPNRTVSYVGGKRNKGITGRELALKTLRSENRVFYANELVNAFVSHGFAGQSAWPIISVLIREGLVRKLGDGKYAAVGTTINLGASNGSHHQTA